jgi:hypothetical protein
LTVNLIYSTENTRYSQKEQKDNILLDELSPTPKTTQVKELNKQQWQK